MRANHNGAWCAVLLFLEEVFWTVLLKSRSVRKQEGVSQ